MPIAAGRPLDASARQALERARRAHERTLMAWVGTSALLIAVGAAGLHWSLRLFALATIGTALIAVVFSSISYRRHMKPLRIGQAVPRRSAAVIAAAVVFGLGTAALMAVLLLA